MKRQADAIVETDIGGSNIVPAKEQRMAPVSAGGLKQRRAVPPGYLHDLLHTRHLMKTVGLKAPTVPSQHVRKSGPPVALTQARLAALPRLTHQATKLPMIPGQALRSLFEERTRYLQKKRRRERDKTPYQQHPGKPTGLLSMPEEVLLKIVCLLQHDQIAPMFTVCKQLNNTLQEAIRAHFNYATPSRAAMQIGPTPAVKRPERRRAMTALADVMAHLRRGQRAVAAVTRVPGSAQSTRPRTLSFTPASTPITKFPTPLAAPYRTPGLQQLTPLSCNE